MSKVKDSFYYILHLDTRIRLVVTCVRHHYCLSFKRLVRRHKLSLLALFLFLQPHTRANEVAEERMWTSGAALEFGMELRGNKPGVVRQLNNLDQAIISRATADYNTIGFHAFAEFIIKFITVAVALKDDRLTVGLIGPGASRQAADPVTEAHGATFVGHLALGQHQVNYRMGCLRIKFRTIGTGKSQDVARKLDHGDLQAQA